MKRTISILIVMFCLVHGLIAYGAVNMKFFGEIDAELRYTPEKEWEGWDCLWLKSSIEGGQGAKAVVVFGENNARRGNPSYWWEGEGRQFELHVDQLYLEYIVPLYRGALPSVITFGDLAFTYHPYLLKLDYWNEGGYLEREYDQSKRGIMIEDIQIGKLNSNAFYLWDGTGELSKYAYGYFLEQPFMKGKVKFYGINFLNNPQIQKVKAIETKQIINNNLTATILGGSLLEENGQSGQFSSYLWEFTGTFKINQNQNFALRYIDFPKSFTPIYRDLTPRYDPRTNKLLSWNELDRYSDQRGFIFSYKHADKTTTFDVDLASLMDHNADHPTKTREVIFRGKLDFLGNTSLNFWERFVDTDYSRVDELFNTKLYHSSKYFVERAFFKDKFLGRYGIAKRNPSLDEICHEISIGQDVKQGLFAGCNYRVGAKHIKPGPNGSFPFLEFSSDFPLGINITARYAGYRRPVTSEYEYDEDEQLIHKDNIFSVQAKISF